MEAETTDLTAENAGGLCVDDDGVLYISIPGIIAFSTDGTTWEQHPVGLSTVQTIAAHYGRAWAGAAGYGSSRFLPNLDRWQMINDAVVGSSLDGGLTTIFMRTADNVYLAPPFGPVLYATADGGETFSAVWYDTDSHLAGRRVDCGGIVEHDGTLYLGAMAQALDNSWCAVWIYRSIDGGLTWSGPEEAYRRSQALHVPRIVVDPTRERLWVATTVGVLTSGLDESEWGVVSGFGRTDGVFTDSQGCVYVTGYRDETLGLYILRPDSVEWEYRPLPFAELVRMYLTVDSTGAFWLGSQYGLWSSTNGGGSWDPITEQEGLASTYINSLALDEADGKRIIWVGTALGASRGEVLTGD